MRISSLHVNPLITLFLLAALLIHSNVNSQERCGTVAYEKMLKTRGTVIETREEFEEWLRHRQENRRIPFRTGEVASGPYQVPVVFHIIHKGEPIGTGVNISDAQIQSQLNVLNNDFNRLNADASNTPAEFLAVAGSLDIEFIFAKRNPEGAATTAINRKQGSKNAWSIGDNYELKSQSYWPAEDFLNIWVTDLSGGYLGYAQTPVSSLPGMENSSNNRLTDGVVIDYRAFGSVDDGPFSLDPQYNKGRTLTHEMAHFLGVRHIWGDDEGDSDKCSGTDYVDDTPNQTISTSGCPTHPRASCASNDMFQNFLDYTNDVCMNLFTVGQVDRMVTVMDNSPRRASLTTSPALLDPVPLANDLGIREVILPTATSCDNFVTPTLLVRNYGNNPISTTRIAFTVDNVLLETLDFALSLSPDQESILEFNEVVLSTGLHDIRYEILLTNGTTDANSGNNVRLTASLIPAPIATPFQQAFNTVPADWTIDNPDQQFTWANKIAPASSPSNRAMFINFYDYEDGEGESDFLMTPVFDLTATPGAYVSFDVAYAQFPGSSDGLRVYVLTDCESNVFNGTRIFEKFGSSLSTSATTSVAFTPAGESQWRTETLSLNEFIGNDKVQLVFVGVNDWGNNLYLDNVRVVTDAEEDLVLEDVLSPSVIVCESDVPVNLLVANGGSVPITSYTVKYRFDDFPEQTLDITTSLDPMDTEQITLAPAMPGPGSHTLHIELTSPNGKVDIIPANSTVVKNFVVDATSDDIPLRQDFETGVSPWTVVNPTNGENWQLMPTNLGNSVQFSAFDNPLPADQSWLISPSFDFSDVAEASVFFDVSYAQGVADDSLFLLATTNCGITFDTVAWYAGESLSPLFSLDEWVPVDTEDWTEKYVVLSAYAGNASVRLAWVGKSNGGNNIYLDNIEFFRSENPALKEVDPPFLIYSATPADPGQFMITFNLEQRSPVGYEVVDVMGRAVAAEVIDNVLNQTFTIDAGDVAAGIYIIRIRIGETYYAHRVYLSGQ